MVEMGRPATSKKTIIEQTINEMHELGIYKKEFYSLVEIYSEMLGEYRLLNRKFKDGQLKQYETSTNGTSKKTGAYLVLETLRKDIASYSDKLMLNPKSLGTKRGDGSDSMTVKKVVEKEEEKIVQVSKKSPLEGFIVNITN